jgi:hypothetical protein
LAKQSPAGTRLTLFSDDKPDRFFTVIKFWMDATSGVALELKAGVPTYQVKDSLARRLRGRNGTVFSAFERRATYNRRRYKLSPNLGSPFSLVFEKSRFEMFMVLAAPQEQAAAPWQF